MRDSGHTREVAVDVFLDPTNYLPLVTMHSLRRILDSLLVVLRASARKFRSVFGPEISDHPRYREALIEASIVNNAALGAYQSMIYLLRNQIAVVRDRLEVH